MTNSTMELRFPCRTFHRLSTMMSYLLIFFATPGNFDFALGQQTHNSRAFSGVSTIYTPSNSPFITTFAPFEWAAGSWSECGSHQNSTHCGQFRDVFCVYTEGIKTQVPFYFCEGIPKPESHRRCLPCPENCVLSSWKLWSDWSSTCKGALRYRARDVIRAPRFGGKWCGQLSQTERNSEFPDCRVELRVPSYQWRIDQWTSCRQPVSMGRDSCLLGRRFRRVDCVDEEGEIVEGDRCLQSAESEVDNTLQTANFPPPSQEVCTLPCDCLVSRWSPWSHCSLTCHDPSQPEVEGHRTRTRRVTRAASNGGLPCPLLQEFQPCLVQNLTACPQYEWYLQDWQQCRLTQNTTAGCGAGIETRQVFCIESGSSTLAPLDDSFCQNYGTLGQFKPVSSRACYVDCPVDCEVGHWSHWSQCSKSCGEGAVQMRTRDIQVAAAYRGAECPARVELRACEAIECAWWHTGRWTACLLDFGYDDCGPGTRLRTVYCMNALNMRVDPSYCAGKTKPPRNGKCQVPCAEECVVSEWSEWGECSVSCGSGGGERKRSRRIIAYSLNKDLNPCLPEEQLSQTKPCNVHVSCHSYSWQATPWGVCTLNGTARCGQAVGIERRDVACEMDTGELADPSQCDAGSMLSSVRICDVSCPVDCQMSLWSSWSACSATCGLHARRTRTKHVMSLPVHGGVPCLPETDANGIITQDSPCISIGECYSYQWVATAWTECQVMGSSCGKGLQTREVHCGRNDGIEAEAGMCLQDFTVPPPTPTQRCYIPCGGDCLLFEWSEYGPCQANCGSEILGGYCRVRSREIVGVAISDNVRELCPHIADSDLHEIIPCSVQNARYTWSYGLWTSCTLPQGLDCGNGKQSRGVVCLQNDLTQVADLFCLTLDPSQATPIEERSCLVNCSIDCEVGLWSNWSSCSQPCGQGEMTRRRTIAVQPLNGGRACPLLIDTKICFERSCDQLNWDIAEWNPCLPTDSRTSCGTGTQTRSVTCLAGPEHEAHCIDRRAKPIQSRNCHLPCTGECVFSEWSAFTACSDPCASGKKSRSRIIIRPNAELQPCVPTKQTLACNQVDCTQITYRLVTGAWSECRPLSGDCGRGTRHQTLNCVDSTGLVVDMNRCQHQNITTYQSCLVDCPIDCQLGVYTKWSECSQMCGSDGLMMRSRNVVTFSSGTGRKCQEVHNLNETKPCNVRPCFSYSWYRGEWGECLFDTKVGCGAGHQARLVECRRSDGLTVDWEYCFMQAHGGSSMVGWNQVETSLNRSMLDVATTRPCQTWCPGDCVVSDWSPFTSCFGNCFNGSISGQETRTRVVQVPAVYGGKECTTELVGTRSCPANKAECPNFVWRAGEWNAMTRRREVWCEMENYGGVRIVVAGGCDETSRPPSSLDCVPECNSVGSYCEKGVCRCATGFMGNGRTCYPAVGCVIDSHCPFPHTVCSAERECTCKPGYFSIDGVVKCVPAQTEEATASDGIAAEGQDDNDTDASPFKGTRGTWKWVVGAVFTGIFILAAILCGALVYKYYHTGEIHFEPIPNSVQYRQTFRASLKPNRVEETKC